MDEGRNRNSTHRAAVLAGMSATALVLITCASLQLQAAPPPASSSSVTSSQAAGQSVSIDCFVVLCENAEAAQKVAELGLKHSAARTGSRDLARELATLPGVSLHTSGRTYAIAGTLAQVMTNRAVGVGSQAGQGRQVEVPFETVPLITGNGVTLKIKVPMAELRGAQGNAGATVSPGQGSGTEIALKPGGVVALDGGMEKGVSSPRQRVFLLMANVVSADQPEASTGSDESPASSRIIIPTVQFNNATVREVVESLKRMARDHNKTGKVVNILLSPEAADSSAKLTLSLKDVPLSVVLHHVAELTMLEMSVLDDRGGVMFRVPGQPSQAARPRPPPAFPARRGPGTTSASQKAGSIILPSVKFSGATITEAVSYLRSKGAELDADKRGVNILLIDSSKAGKISLDLKDVPLSEALRHVAELGNMELVVEETTFVIRPWRK